MSEQKSKKRGLGAIFDCLPTRRDGEYKADAEAAQRAGKAAAAAPGSEGGEEARQRSRSFPKNAGDEEVNGKAALLKRPTLRRFPLLDKEGNIVSEHDSSAPRWMIYPDSNLYKVQRTLVVVLTLMMILIIILTMLLLMILMMPR